MLTLLVGGTVGCVAGGLVYEIFRPGERRRRRCVRLWNWISGNRLDGVCVADAILNAFPQTKLLHIVDYRRLTLVIFSGLELL